MAWVLRDLLLKVNENGQRRGQWQRADHSSTGMLSVIPTSDSRRSSLCEFWPLEPFPSQHRVKVREPKWSNTRRIVLVGTPDQTSCSLTLINYWGWAWDQHCERTGGNDDNNKTKPLNYPTSSLTPFRMQGNKSPHTQSKAVYYVIDANAPVSNTDLGKRAAQGDRHALICWYFTIIRKHDLSVWPPGKFIVASLITFAGHKSGKLQPVW